MVWPMWVRVVHWLVASAIVLNIFIVEDGDAPHRYIGYAALALVLARLVFGSRSRRRPYLSIPFLLRQCRKIPEDIRHFFKKRRLPYYTEHSPLASLVILGIWACVLALAVTGYLLGTDAFFGEESMEDMHEAFSTGLLILIIGHLAGLINEAIFHRYNIFAAMIKGNKPR